MNIKDLIKDNYVKFESLRQGFAYYKIKYGNESYIFQVPLSDIGDATLLATDKAIFFMRYIRKSIEDKTFIAIREN